MNNTVELLGYYGSDETIACSAWTSTSRELTKEKRDRIGGLIKYLWENEHETPFEKATVHFLVNTDIATHIHLLKHRISSLNAESARYKELKEDKYFLPNDWLDSDVGKKHYNRLVEMSKLTNQYYHEAVEELTPVLGRKRAKESCRFFKMYNSQIQADVMFNMRSFANFLKLRYSEHAQKEINDVAVAMLESVKSIKGNPFKHTLIAWGYEENSKRDTKEE